MPRSKKSRPPPPPRRARLGHDVDHDLDAADTAVKELDELPISEDDILESYDIGSEP